MRNVSKLLTGSVFVQNHSAFCINKVTFLFKQYFISFGAVQSAVHCVTCCCPSARPDVYLEYTVSLQLFKNEPWSPKAPLPLRVNSAMSMLIILALCSVRDKINKEQAGQCPLISSPSSKDVSLNVLIQKLAHVSPTYVNARGTRCRRCAHVHERMSKMAD